MPSNNALSRRGFLLAGLTGVAASALPSLASTEVALGRVSRTSPASLASLQSVKPIWSNQAYRAFGVCAHPNFGNSVYQYTDAWMKALASTGASYFRGMYSSRASATGATVRAARQNGVQWAMGVYPDDWSMTDSALVSQIKDIAANAADVCLYIEGINEPNYSRGGGSVPTDWVQRTVAKQKIIWETVKGEARLAHVKVVGPSLQAVQATEADYGALANAGITQYLDFAGLHRYPGGRYPDYLLDERLAWIRRQWHGKPTWITETGYTNAVASRVGHPPVPESVSAAYAPSALLEAVDRGCHVSWFELLDDPDPGAKDVIESNFGMFATGAGAAPPWREKPVVGTMRSFLAALKDPGAAFDPPLFKLAVNTGTADVRTTLMAKRDGSHTLFVRRATDCWNTATQTAITVRKVPVSITTATGTTTVYADHKVVPVNL
jgi:hypothetical protein